MSELIDVCIPAEQQEGTEFELGSWLKGVGDPVKQHEPVAELVTDKAVVEILSPADGVLEEILVPSESSVEPGMVIGRLAPGESVTDSNLPTAIPEAPTLPDAPLPVRPQSRAQSRTQTQTPTERPEVHPAVARFARRRGLDLDTVAGTGRDGRVTQPDVLAALGEGAGARVEPTAPRVPMPAISGPSRTVSHDPMRRTIARRMADSVQVAPHVTAAFDCDLSCVIADREQRRAELAERGVKLTFSAYFLQAVVAGIRSVPEINSRWNADGLEIFEHVHVGVGTALEDRGLVVPVVHDAHDLDLEATARRLTELTELARAGKLQPAQMQGSTFTISNHGVMGSLFAAPIIINQPESAILGVGKLERRPRVVGEGDSETIEVRSMLTVTLTIDHRALDAFHCNRFLTTFVDTLEAWG